MTASEAEIVWLHEFFMPSLKHISPGKMETSIEVVQCEEAYSDAKREFQRHQIQPYDCFTLDGRFESFPGCAVGEGKLLIALERFRVFLRVNQPARQILLIALQQSSKIRLALMRVVREVATSAALEANAIPLHGSACAETDRAIGFIGQKRSGKTTTLLQHLLEKQCRFLSNDRFFLIRRDGRWFLRGMPTIVKIRHSCLELYPKLQHRLICSPYHRERSLEEIRTSPGKRSENDNGVSLSQAQLLQLTKAESLTECPLDRILVPTRDDSVATDVQSRLTSIAALEFIAANFLKPGNRIATSEVFSPEFDQVRYENDLKKQLAKLVEDVAVCELRQNRSMFDRSRSFMNYRDAA